LAKYRIAETENYSKKVTSIKYNHLYKKIIEDIYPVLRENPFFGGSIKKLKGDYKNVYRFRIGNYRLFYIIDEQEALVFIIDVESRQDAYK
jgi:mRNA interferase RelE/StbE